MKGLRGLRLIAAAVLVVSRTEREGLIFGEVEIPHQDALEFFADAGRAIVITGIALRGLPGCAHVIGAAASGRIGTDGATGATLLGGITEATSPASHESWLTEEADRRIGFA